MNNKEIKKDYSDFINSEERAPKNLASQLFNKVQEDLNPDKLTVFIKLLCLQLFVGILTMILCPQFKMSLTNNYELFHYFHHTFGQRICMAICGAIFLGSGAIAASYILNLEEIRVIRNTRGLYFLAISGISLIGFMLFGAELYLDLTLIWVVGASLAASLMLAFNNFLRRKLLQVA